MTDEEARRLAASGTVAGLCPITEANLGDGLFSARPYLDAGGVFGVGSDSNVLIDLAEELRLLEYGQRLERRERNVFAAPGGSTARGLFEGALAGGARALGRPAAGFVVGADADVVVWRADALENVRNGGRSAIRLDIRRPRSDRPRLCARPPRRQRRNQPRSARIE